MWKDNNSSNIGDESNVTRRRKRKSHQISLSQSNHPSTSCHQPKFHSVSMTVFLFLFALLLSWSPSLVLADSSGVDLWQMERPADMARIEDLEVMCGKQHMEVQLTFDRPFNGIVFSKGAVDTYDCIYVKPQSGQKRYKFDIRYDSCASKPDLNGKFYENNIVIQYDKDLIEVWDEAKRLRCEWYNDYEKGVTKPPIRVSDLEVIELNFRGDNVDCWMEIQQGKGPWASPVSGIVPLGTTLTMVVGIDDKQGEFDMRVKSCEASDSNSRPIELSDENGCVLRPKMISKFMKMRSTDPRATVVTYAFFHAFKFPDSMAVQIRCKVEICRYGCPDHCQSPGSYVAREHEVSSAINSYGSGNPGSSLQNPFINDNNLARNDDLYQAAPSQSEPQYSPPAPAAQPQIQAKKDSEEQQEPAVEDSFSAPLSKSPSPSPRPQTRAQPRPRPNQQPRRPIRPRKRRPFPVYQKRRRNDNEARKDLAGEQPENERSGGKYAPAPLNHEKKQQHREAKLNRGPSRPNDRPDVRRRPPGPPRRRPPPPPRPHSLRPLGANRRSERPVSEEEKESGLNFLGLKLPELPKISLPFFGDSQDKSDERDDNEEDRITSKIHHVDGMKVKSEAIPISLGRRPPKDALHHNNTPRQPPKVPVSRTKSKNKEQPLVYPSSFNTANAPVVPLEKVSGPFPYGPRALNIETLEKMEVQKRRRRRSVRTARSADIGVRSGYEVVSEVDLAFSPSDDDGHNSVAVLNGKRRVEQEEIVYGICLPASGFSALFVLLALLTVISIIVSGFVCYQRQVQKAVEEGAPVEHQHQHFAWFRRKTPHY